MPTERLLVLCVDVDNDLWEKAKVKGPVMGRKDNLEAASKFCLADPMDTDGNTIYQAIRTHDELKKEGHEVELATITGHRDLGYRANAEISRQLEHAIKSFKPTAAVFVSDGASDEQVLPMVQSRLKINSVETVTVKQSKELEKTYFVLLEKLKEPQFARVAFGVPGFFLVLYFLLQDLGARLFLGIFGTYLILKGFGIEEKIIRSASRADVSVGRVSFIFYFGAFALFIVSAYLGIARLAELQSLGITNYAKIVAYSLKDFMLIFPVSLLLVIAAQALDSLEERKAYQLPSHAVAAFAVVLFAIATVTAAEWVIGSVSFSDFFFSLAFMAAAMYFVIYLSKEFKAGLVSRLNLKGKEVFTEIGGFLGKVEKFDKAGDYFVVHTKEGRKLNFDSAHLSSIGDKLIVKY